MVRRRTSRDRANWLRCSERHLRTARCIHTAGELWFVDSWGARVLHAWALAHLGGRPVSVPQWGKVGLAVSGIAAKCSAGDVSDVKKHLAELVETAMRSPLSSMIASELCERPWYLLWTTSCVQHLAFHAVIGVCDWLCCTPRCGVGVRSPEGGRADCSKAWVFASHSSPLCGF